jgi:hypothetical protein
MDDLAPFERQVAGEMVRRSGPVQPVDDAAIYASISAADPSARRRLRSLHNAISFRSTADRPAPIPVTNGHTPTVTMRTQIMFSPAKAITAGALVIGGALLIAQPFQQERVVPSAATDPVPEPSVVVPHEAALVTGEFVPGPAIEFPESSEADGILRERNREIHGRTEMSDPRLSGDVVTVDNADRFCGGPCAQDTYHADVLWGTIEIVNEGGTWAGTSVGTTDLSAEGTGITHFELVGSGDYGGLSAVLFQTETFDQEAGAPKYPMNGVIFPGALPPDR